MTNAPDWIAHHALWSPDRAAMTDVESSRTFTYAQMNDRCARLATFLRQSGVGKGDRVAVLAHNSTDILEIQFACVKLGAIFVPLNWRLSASELHAILTNAEPAVLIHGREFTSVADEMRARGICASCIDICDGGSSAYEEGIAAAVPLAEAVPVTHDDIFAIMYTSGTTGLPKGAIITHRMTIFTALNGMMKAGVSAASTGLTFLPLFHVGGLFLMANFIFHAGGHNVVMRSFDPERALALLSDSALKVTHSFGVPTNFLLMAQAPGFAAADLTHVECLTVGGAPAPISLLRAYIEKGIALQQAWGMTETATMGTMLARDDVLTRVGSAGRPVMHAQLRILDEQHEDAEPGAVGQLAISGPTVTPGYWRQPEATARSFAGEWFLTGDAARQDEDGYLYIVDRWKDMYISGGENVYPAELENVLQAIPGVVEAAVVGVPDEKWGEVGFAFLDVRAGFAMSRDDILGYCERHIARFKLPKYMRIGEKIPHTAAGKIAKPELRQRAASIVQQGISG